jgi:hypothetical protein
LINSLSGEDFGSDFIIDACAYLKQTLYESVSGISIEYLRISGINVYLIRRSEAP